MGRVVGSELIEAARQRGRIVFEVLPGDIVTDIARETAGRLGIRLVDGPIERPAHAKSDGRTALRRGLYRRGAKWVAPDSCACPFLRNTVASGPIFDIR